MTNKSAIQRFWVLTPIIGSVLFMVLYIVSTFYYPGGSQLDKNAAGFSWVNNYWCNLLNDKAINGQSNDAQPIALTAMLILCLALTSFWFQFPGYTSLSKKYQLTIQFCGALAMTISFFLFTGLDHDLITNGASLFGLIATAGTFTGLYRNGWKRLYYLGLFNIMLIVVNNILYYNKGYIAYLPLVQKITFAAFLTWICCIDFKIYALTIEKNG